MLGKILKEPLLHFAILGFGLFALFAFLNVDDVKDQQPIVVSEFKIDQLSYVFNKKRGRDPDAGELNRMINDFVMEEIYYREALAMQMDKNDTIIRRRLRQKMEFLLADASDVTPPTDIELQAYIAANPEAFEAPALYSFQQIYLDPGSGVQTQRVAEIENQLSKGAIPSGDTSTLPRQMQAATANRIDHLFGHQFSKHFDTLPLQTWQGPFTSGYGLHWINIRSREARPAGTLDEVRDDVIQAYTFDQRVELQKQITQKLMEKYQVTIHQQDKDA